ncbi:hypothetical protein KEM63_05870 [Halopseudomonas nanhaiensis]|uniref:hypothetical protein n=1 Tax=Halopseudomonas nanhaiensis TaxID=2830842 RepID=UPI001CBC9CD5|nr:hypothetical protein [Halopseudomonas nanhaiensis]UAW99494.1 hypothetical protein KEM63_05870 [Halopseudomonas nanhaiensis]
MKKLNIFSFLFLFFVLCSTAIADPGEDTFILSIAETHLDHLKLDQQVWEKLPSEATAARTLLSESITRKLVMLSGLEFSTADVRAPRLEILCLLKRDPSTYQSHNHHNLSKIADRFLNNIISEVMHEIESAQRVLYGKECYVSPDHRSGRRS